MKIFYTYLWLREDGTPYYVGKGTGRRAFVISGRKNVIPPIDKGRILIQDFPCEADALAAEIFLIAYYGRKDTRTGILRNLTDGGENPPRAKKGQGLGIKRSPEVCQNLSISHRGLKQSEATRLKKSLALKGRQPSEQCIQKSREACHGRSLSKEHRQKISEGGRGLRRSETTRQKMRESFKGRKIPTEVRQRISFSVKKYFDSEGARARMREVALSRPKRLIDVTTGRFIKGQHNER